MDYYLIKVGKYSDTSLFLTWHSHETFELAYSDLRYHCPCALCVDEITGQRLLQKDSIAKNIHILQAHSVGRYAMQFTWSDNHQTGIYHFNRLYQICSLLGKACKEDIA